MPGAPENGRFAAEGLRIAHPRPDGTVAFAQLVVVHEPEGVTEGNRQQVRTWLDPFEDELIGAATDDNVELVPDDPRY